MADFTQLKTAIQQYIAQNGNKEITGNLLQTILLAMVQSMGDQAINGVLQMLSNEMIARENQDGYLGQALTAEQQRAIAAETKSAVLDGETKTLVFKNAAGQPLYQVSMASLVSNGLVDVEVDGTNLVMTFHTDSGNEEITIPIGDIFNPSNYYTKTQVDGLLSPITTAITNVSSRLNAGYIYLGLADPETIPTSATGKFFYIASQAGTYHFMSNGDIPIVISSDGLYILSGGVEADDWYLETIVTFTNNAQFNSSRLITSGGVFNAINPINELLHRNYILAGVADTTTIPTDDTNVFYLAGQGGTYTHFLNGDEDPLVLPKGLTVIYRGVEDDGWNYWVVYADNDFINTNRAQELSSAQKSLARTNMDVYSKSEVNSLITTPDQGYVTVTATDQTTSVTDVLPATGQADTIYRVGSWNGTQYDADSYSEYGWNGTNYVLLDVKETGIDDEPTAGSKNLIESGGVYKALGIQSINANSIIGHLIKELYLTGLNESSTYDIMSYGTYSGKTRQTFVIYEGAVAVAQSDTAYTERNTICSVFALNNSGISGYVIYDMFSLPDIVLEAGNVINVDIVSKSENSPSIYAFLTSQNLHSEIENVESSVENIGSVLSVNNEKPYNIDFNSIGAYNSDSLYFTCGYNKPLEKDIILDSIEISANPSSLNVNQEINVYAGIIDQRGWFILDKTIRGYVESKGSDYITIKFNDKPEISKGNIIIVECGISWGFISTYSNPDDMQAILQEYHSFVHINPSNLPTGVTQRTDVSCNKFIINGYSVDSVFATKLELENVAEQVYRNSNAIAKKDIYIDEATGLKYRLSVRNGQIVLTSMNLSKLLFIGNSYTEHSNSPDVWWGNGRGMAASVDATQYTQLIAIKTGATFSKGNYAHFEVNYSPNYDFENYIPINANDYDLVVVQLFENASYSSTMQASWEALYDYIRSKCPNAFIIQIVGWYEQNKYNAVSNAAQNKGVVLLNCSDVTALGQYALGDYVSGSDNSYHAILNSGVVNHPSDIGFYGIANKILSVYDIELDTIHSISINQGSGVTVSTPYEKWIAGGIVNIRIVSGTVTNITVLDASNNTIAVTQRDATHYTFIMPDSNVVISVN